MPLILLIFFVAAPLAEVYLLIQAGAAFGALPVILSCVATAMIGGALWRRQGLAAIARAQRDVEARRFPLDSIIDGGGLLIAAPLLITPGYITDIAGFLLLTPPVRRWLAGYLVRKFRPQRAEEVVIIDLEPL